MLERKKEFSGVFLFRTWLGWPYAILLEKMAQGLAYGWRVELYDGRRDVQSVLGSGGGGGSGLDTSR